VTRIVRWECGMKQPGLSTGYASRSRNVMTVEEVAIVTGHKALNTASTGLGGYYSTHNAAVHVLDGIGKACGLHTTRHLGGMLGSVEGSNIDTVGDLLFTGLDPSNNGLMIDVSVTHPVTGKGKAKYQSALVTGHAGQQVMKKKSRRYQNLCQERGMESCWFVTETTGGMAEPTIELLKRLARHHAEHIDIGRLSARDTPNALAGRRYHQWLQAFSIANARTIADRLRGAAAEALSNATLPRRNAAALLLQGEGF
jgi:hypothetical protein